MTSYNLAVALGSSVAAASAHTDPDLGLSPSRSARAPGTARACLCLTAIWSGDAARQHGQAQPERMIRDLRHRSRRRAAAGGGQRLVPEQLYAQLIARCQRHRGQVSRPQAHHRVPSNRVNTHRPSLIATALAALSRRLRFHTESEAAVAQYEASAPENGQPSPFTTWAATHSVALCCARNATEVSVRSALRVASPILAALISTIRSSGTSWRCPAGQDDAGCRPRRPSPDPTARLPKETLSSQTAVTCCGGSGPHHRPPHACRIRADDRARSGSHDRCWMTLSSMPAFRYRSRSRTPHRRFINAVAQRLSESLDRPIVTTAILLSADSVLHGQDYGSQRLGAGGDRRPRTTGSGCRGSADSRRRVGSATGGPVEASTPRPRSADGVTAAVVTVVTLLLSGSSSAHRFRRLAVDEASTRTRHGRRRSAPAPPTASLADLGAHRVEAARSPLCPVR